MKLFDYFNSDDQISSNCNLTQDEIHKILSASRRREAIRVVNSVGKITIGRLADEISDRESSERQSVYVALYQNHLSVLSKYSVVEYDKDRGTVCPGRNIETLNAVMQDVQSRLN